MGEVQTLVSTDRCYTDSVEQAIGVYDASPYDPVRAGIKAAVEMAEENPEGAQQVLWKLQGDWSTLERLQTMLGGEPTRAALRMGAAIQAARAELFSPAPQMRRRLPEILEWLDDTD